MSGQGIPNTLRTSNGYSEQNAMTWLQDVRRRKNNDGSQFVRKAQIAVLQNACARICDELAQAARKDNFTEPLMWCMHGGPGVGKSKVLLLVKEIFTDACVWQMGLEYQTAALHAVMAEQLGGGVTLHHACGDLGQQLPSRLSRRRSAWDA